MGAFIVEGSRQMIEDGLDPAIEHRKLDVERLDSAFETYVDMMEHGGPGELGHARFAARSAREFEIRVFTLREPEIDDAAPGLLCAGHGMRQNSRA